MGDLSQGRDALPAEIIARLEKALKPFKDCTQRVMGSRPSSNFYSSYGGEDRDVEITYGDLYALAAAYREVIAALRARSAS